MSGEKEDCGEIENLMEMMEKEKYDSRIASVLEERGRSCISKAYLKKARDAAKGTKNTDEFLKRLAGVMPYLKREKGGIYMVYPKCFCHKIKAYKGKIPEGYCNCSIGWVKELFEQALGNPIDVRLESSILRGDKECRLEVFI
jgi:hypothetical protein